MTKKLGQPLNIVLEYDIKTSPLLKEMRRQIFWQKFKPWLWHWPWQAKPEYHWADDSEMLNYTQIFTKNDSLR